MATQRYSVTPHLADPLLNWVTMAAIAIPEMSFDMLR